LQQSPVQKVEGSVTSPTLAADRLIDSQKKTKARLEAQTIERIKEEQATMKASPSISDGSKRLLKAKQYVPIYSNERQQQILSTRKQKIEKMRLEVEMKKRIEEEKTLNSTTPLISVDLFRDELCFDPRSVRSVVYERSAKNNGNQGETSEEHEIRSCCSFHPSTNQKSNLLFSKV